MDDDLAYAEIQRQIGRAAGNIAATNLRYYTWLTDRVSNAARAMQVSLRSAWVLREIWNNGMTIWESPGGGETATVTPAGRIHVQETWREAGIGDPW
jgi:hypothetical protein